MKPAYEFARKCVDLLEKSNWIQGSYGNGKDAFCALGVINYVSDSVGYDCSEIKFRKAVVRASGSGVAIPRWNDAPGRTKEEVLAAFKKAKRMLR